MPFYATWPTSFEKEVEDSIRDAIGREIYWYIVASSTPCPVCDLDPVTNTSTDSFCTICSGEYWIPTYSGIPINGHISWGFTEQLGWVTGGQMEEGECRASIEYTEENLSTVTLAKYAVVDNKIMQIIKVRPRGVQTINRLLVDLIEKGE